MIARAGAACIADLRARCACAAGCRVERVLRGAGRGAVEGLEVVVVRLDLGPLGHGEAQAGEDRDDLVAHLDQGVPRAARGPAPRQGEIGTREGALVASLALAGLGQARLQQLEVALGLVGGGPHERALIGRQGAERAQELGQCPLTPEDADADLLQFGRRAGGLDRGARLAGDGLDARMGHGGQRAAALALSTSLVNPTGSLMASSDSTFRFSATPAFLSPAMKTE